MSTFHVVQYTPDSFLDVALDHDTTWTNFTLGTLLDSSTPNNKNGTYTWLPKERFLIGVLKENKPVVFLTKIEGGFAWSITHPRDTPLSVDEINQSLVALASSLPSILAREATITPDILLKVDKVMGPASLARPFIHTWKFHIASHHGTHTKQVDHHFTPDVSYATLATIPPPSSVFSSDKYDIRRATEEHIEQVVPLFVEFALEVWHHPIPLENAIEAVQEATSRKQLWFVYYKDANQPDASKTISGFLVLGRETPRTIAIRNMFVSPAFRRKGVAEALIRAATRFYLGAEPLGFDLQGAEPVRPKEEVCLNVADPGAKRLYIRCGYQLEGDQTDAVTGKRKWYPTSLLGVEPVETGKE